MLSDETKALKAIQEELKKLTRTVNKLVKCFRAEEDDTEDSGAGQ